MDKKNDLYKIGTKNSVINGYFPRTDLQKCKLKLIQIDEVPKGILIPLSVAATQQSMTGGQGFRKCNCKSAKNYPKECLY